MLQTSQLKQFESLFNTEFISKISEVATLHHFEKDDIIIDINQDLTSIPLLTKGLIKVTREDQDSNEILLYLLKEGDTCAMSLTCCMADRKSKIRAIAETDVDLNMIPVDYMNLWFSTEPQWQQFILTSYQSRFDEMLQTIDTLAFLNMDERLLNYLQTQSQLKNSETLNISHQDIALDLNTSRVVISRVLKKLENQGHLLLGRNQITLHKA
ncbi:Crp/Fnr family transcriptional regulator [Winogradskyella maritima]|uniref:Crp/Fnr family transcriptional regulator n=1 Tax=Winogradskyella maritima TaxID=1517766 RepID=A0ABV8AL53_9FLAO|nr:Crp/Fnr family transcriptional regulator [Winogradskyella maritima]